MTFNTKTFWAARLEEIYYTETGNQWKDTETHAVKIIAKSLVGGTEA